MKKLIPLVLVITLALINPQKALGAASVKAGAKCKVNGQIKSIKGTIFTCTKSGKKLVWVAGLNLDVPIIGGKKIPQATPNATPPSGVQTRPNPFDSTPFPDEFTRAEMVEAALRSFDEYVKQNNSNQPFKLIIDKDFEHKSKDITKVVEDVFASLPFPAGYPTAVFVVTRDRKFIESSVREFSDFYKSPQMDIRPCLNCASLGWANTSLGLTNVIPHEIFHVWQSSVYRKGSGDRDWDPNNPLNPPIWLDEGGAEFFMNVFYRRVDNYYPGSLVSLKPYHLKDYTTRNLDGQLPYSLGRLASEYIVASKGYEKFLSIYSNVGLGLDFPTAFENATGISIDGFYEKFDNNLPKML